MNKPLAPIALFVYNRPEHTRRTLEALAANRLAGESELYVFCDGPKAGSSPQVLAQIQAVRELVIQQTWPARVHIRERATNAGLAASIIEGVTEITGAHGRIIVLEDDIVTSPAFLEYMNFALEHFKDEERVGSVNGWMRNIPPRLLPPYFFLPGGDCWGWATWERAWKCFEPDSSELIRILEADAALRRHYDDRWMDILSAQARGQVSSWHIRWHTSLIVKGKVGLFPARSYICNIGNEGSGTHTASTDQGRYRYPLNAGKTIPYIQRMRPAVTRYANWVLEQDRKRIALKFRAMDHIAYRYPRLANRMGLPSNSRLS